MDFMSLFGIVPTIYGFVKQAVQDFESPDVPGASKKELVLAVIKAALDAIAGVGVKTPATVILTIASALIDVVVAGFNLVGIFSKKPAPTPAAG
jgi:hypothetical protein